jgi:hypothetical protein
MSRRENVGYDQCKRPAGQIGSWVSFPLPCLCLGASLLGAKDCCFGAVLEIFYSPPNRSLGRQRFPQRNIHDQPGGEIEAGRDGIDQEILRIV